MKTRHWALIPEVRAGTENQEGSGAAAEGHYAGSKAQQPRGLQTQSQSALISELSAPGRTRQKLMFAGAALSQCAGRLTAVTV